jgi:transposase
MEQIAPLKRDAQLCRGEAYRLCRRAHSEEGWSPWDDEASTRRSCVSGRYGWYLSTRPNIHRSGDRFGRWQKIGCPVEVLRRWVRQAERDTGRRPSLTTDERARLNQLEKENAELRRANDILKKASAYFAQAELDRRAK